MRKRTTAHQRGTNAVIPLKGQSFLQSSLLLLSSLGNAVFCLPLARWWYDMQCPSIPITVSASGGLIQILKGC